MRCGRIYLLLLVAAVCLIALGCGSNVQSSAGNSGGSTGGTSTGTSGGSSTGGASSSSTVQVSVSGPSSVRIGSSVQLSASVNGTASGSVTWTVNGVVGGNSAVGTISTDGLYTPPAVLPNPNSVAIAATTNTSPAASGTLTESLLNPAPGLTTSQPSTLLVGTDATVTLSGSGFVSGSTILVNGTAVSTVYMSSSQLTATVSGSLLASGSVTFAVRNPDPGSSTSNSITVSTTAMPADTAQISLTPGIAVPQNFLGMSYEWGDSAWVMGWPSVKNNTIYRQLLKNLMAGHDAPMIIRIGGGTTDTTTWPTDPTNSGFPAYASLATDMNVHFVFGVNLAADNVDMATAQAQFYVSQMPVGTVDAIEIGNEPDDYQYNGIRPSTYTINDFLREFGEWRQNIQPVLPSSTHFMGPSWGILRTLVQHLPDYEAQEAATTSIISHHVYAGNQDNGETFPNDYLLTPSASTAGPASVANYAALAHSRGQLFRVGEANSIDRGGVPGVSDTFESALWAVDWMFEFTNDGIDGINWHGMTGCTYCALTLKVINNGPHGHDYSLTKVNPLYYGMLFFQKATGNHAKLLPVKLQTDSNIKVWATIDQSNTVYVVILNKDEAFAGNFGVNLPGYSDAQVIRMTAPSYQSSSGITIGGQTFDGSTDGNLVGAASNETIQPQNGTYNVNLQPTSAVLLVLKK